MQNANIFTKPFEPESIHGPAAKINHIKPEATVGGDCFVAFDLPKS